MQPQLWAYQLPIILLSLRNTIHQDLNFSQSETVLGHKVRLPGTLFLQTENPTAPP